MPYYQSKKFRHKHSEFQKREKHKSQSFHREEDDSHRPSSKRENGPIDKINKRKHLIIIFHISGSRRRDLDGMVSTVFDSLVRSGVIPDDNLGIIAGITSCYVTVNSGSEGVDILLVDKE